MEDKQGFSWKSIGNIGEGRPNLGDNTSVAIYRLMLFSIKDILEKNFGGEKTVSILNEAGKISGREFCRNMLNTDLPINKFLAQLHSELNNLSVGILKIENFDKENFKLLLTISEDLDCSGIPATGKTECAYDEGFLEGIFEEYTGKEIIVREIDCWSTGDKTCRFSVNVKPV